MSLSAVEDQVALRHLVSIYASYVDDGDAERMAGLFAPGGQLVVYNPGGRPRVDTPLRFWEGAEGFGRLIGALKAAYVRWYHFIGNHWVDVDGDRARGETYCIASHLREGQPQSEEVNLIRYWDDYVRTPAGWRFSARHCVRQWGGIRPLDSGLHEMDALLHGRPKA